MKAALYVVESSVLKCMAKAPLVTPNGNPGGCWRVAIPILVGGVTQQWIWASVVVPNRFWKAPVMDNVCSTLSKTTETEPVPGELLGGFSLVPLRVAVNVNGIAWLGEGVNRSRVPNTMIMVSALIRHLPMHFDFQSTQNSPLIKKQSLCR